MPLREVARVDRVQREFLQRSRRGLVGLLEKRNQEFARQLLLLRDSIVDSHGLFGERLDPADRGLRDLVKRMIEDHPGGEEARRVLRTIEETEARLATVEAQLGAVEGETSEQ